MSAATVTGLIPTNSSAANFRAWGSAISAQIAAVGWVQTADTGQINWTTVAAPIASNTSQGYEIWRMNDSLQGSFPVYMKIEYGSGFSAINNPGIWVTLGNGSNGSGTLTNANTRLQMCSTVSDTVSTGYSSYFSGTTGSFQMAMFAHATQSGIAWSFQIERSRDSSGAETGNFVYFSSFYGLSGTTNYAFQVGQPSSNSWRTQIVSSSGFSQAMAPIGATTGAIGADVGVYPVLLADGGIYLNAGLSYLGFFLGDFTFGVAFSVIIYGVSHTYMPLSNVTPWNQVGNRGGNSNLKLAMRYE